MLKPFIAIIYNTKRKKMNKNYIIAVDGYTMTGRDGYNSNTYIIKENKVSPLKEEDGVKVANLEAPKVLEACS